MMSIRIRYRRHFLNHLAPGGTAGFVMATGELSNSETARIPLVVEMGPVVE